MTEERKREIQAELDEELRQFRADKEKMEKGEPLESLLKLSPERYMLYPNGFQINPKILAEMTEEERAKEQQRIDNFNRKLKIHNEHMDAIRRNHVNSESIKDAILTEEELQWWNEDNFFVEPNSDAGDFLFDENDEVDQEYKAMLVDWFKTEDGQKFIKMMTDKDMLYLKNYFSDEELEVCLVKNGNE